MSHYKPLCFPEGKLLQKKFISEISCFEIYPRFLAEQLHRKIKAKAAMEGEPMAKMLWQILVEEFK